MNDGEGIGKSSFEGLDYDNGVDVAFKLWQGLRQDLASCRKSD